MIDVLEVTGLVMLLLAAIAAVCMAYWYLFDRDD
jgi:hypothetical protein